MEKKNLRVLIVSKLGAHQKAIQAMCAAIPQISTIETVTSPQKAWDRVNNNQPDLLIFGVNLDEADVCELVEKMQSLPKPPYSIALTLSEFNKCFKTTLSASRVIPTNSFAYQLPRILEEVGS